jgi:hypothetical protein
MNAQTKALAVEFLRVLRRGPEERKFDFDQGVFTERMVSRHDEIMKNFRENLNVK